MVRLLNAVLIFLIVAGCTSRKPPEPPVNRLEDPARGAALFNNSGCATCHSFNGEAKYGPQLGAIFNREIEVFRQGKKITVKADREYLLRSLKNPDYEKVVGFQKRKMPVPDLTPESIEYLVDYLISVNKRTTKDSIKSR